MARTLTLKFAGRCATCGQTLRKGTVAVWEGRGVVKCTGCADDTAQDVDNSGIRQMEDYMDRAYAGEDQ